MDEYKFDEARANARRIVACVNACEGMPTWKLARDGLPSVSEYVALTKQRDDLVAALKKYQAAGFGNSTDFAKQGEAYDAAIEALASVEEGK